ncbi:MAG TPA: squalene/phytoene synthase family protein [Candidatus Saccharimonadales bacterium]|nr:squalene/phytoene synthase family protein [Candidatus Saccharimonadales bacterium]
MNLEEEIGKEGRIRRIAGSLFFGSYLRNDVARLQEFVLVAHDYARNQPAQLQALAAKWQACSDAPMRELDHKEGDDPTMLIAKNIARLKIMYGFDVAWVDAFLVAMLHPASRPKTLAESLDHVYASAETIGLMVASMLRLPKDARPAAQAQARAIQWITFVRDIGNNNPPRIHFFPKEDLVQFGLKDVSQKTAEANPVQFGAFIALQLSRYRQWQDEASADMAYVPRRPRVAINTVADGYRHTAKVIAKHPLALFERTMHPSQTRQWLTLLGHSFD